VESSNNQKKLHPYALFLPEKTVKEEEKDSILVIRAGRNWHQRNELKGCRGASPPTHVTRVREATEPASERKKTISRQMPIGMGTTLESKWGEKRPNTANWKDTNEPPNC